MKKYILAFALLIGVASFYNTAEAQNINISINIGRQPAWGPVGYDYAGYYYFPDIDIYYDVNVGLFYYADRGRWISARYLPYHYRNYDLYRLHKVVLNVHQPWRYHSTHYRDYARYRGYHKQVVIRDSRDARYHKSRNNRVTWYSSDNKRPTNGKYTTSPRTERNYLDNKKVTDNRKRNDNYRSDNKRNDNKNQRPANNNYRTENNKSQKNYNNNPRQERSRSNDNYKAPKSQTREKSSSNSGQRESSRKSSDYRLASNTGNSGRSR